MASHKTFLIVFLSGVIIVSSEIKLCCPENQNITIVHSNETENYLCLNTQENSTKVIDLGCKNLFKISDDDTVSLKTDNDILKLDFHYTVVEPDMYCFGNYVNTADLNMTTEKIAIICDASPETVIQGNVLAYLMIVSVVFYFLVAVVYVALPEMRDVQSMSITSHCGCLAIALSILSYMQVGEYTDMNLCAARGFFLYFFLIAGFFWMSAISIQIMISMKHPTSNYGWKNFLWYSLYAYGLSSVLTVVVVTVNYMPGTHNRPGIGLNHCWFISHAETWTYLYSVMTVLILVNLIVFAYMSFILCRHKFTSGHAKASRYKFLMMFRLFIVLGLPWILEMLTTLFEFSFFTELVDVFIALQGPIYFLTLVILRKRVVKAMYKHRWLDCISGLVEKHLAKGDDDEGIAVETTLNDCNLMKDTIELN